jgi:hypothetical protein
MGDGLLELFRIYLAIAVAGLCDGGLLLALGLAWQERISLFALAPLAGLPLLAALGTLFYTFGLDMTVAVLLAALTLSLATVAGFLVTGAMSAHKREFVHLFPIVLILGAVSGLICNSPLLLGHGPALLLRDGTDSMGYAMNGQLLLDHRMSNLPRPSANDPYDIIPGANLRVDYRLSAYVIVAAGTLLADRPALFAYDFVCAVVLASALLALAGLASTNSLAILALSGLLLLGNLPDFSRTGFFGKLLAYPSILVVVVLLLRRIEATDRWSAIPLMALTVYAVSVTTLHSMVSEFCLVTAAAGLFFLYSSSGFVRHNASLSGGDLGEMRSRFGAAIFVSGFVGFCILTSGAVLANINGILQVDRLNSPVAFSPNILWRMGQDIEPRMGTIIQHSGILSVLGDAAHLERFPFKWTIS